MFERPADYLDAAADLAERERAAALARHAERRAREAAAAAHAVAECKDCGAAIDPARLAAVPYTSRCMPCERVATQRGGRRG